MAERRSFPEPGCYACSHFLRAGGICNETRYCMGVKSKKGKRFKASESWIKAPKWCPKRIPPVCRIYGFADEHSKWLEQAYNAEFSSQKKPCITVNPWHFTLRKELHLGLKAKDFYETVRQETVEVVLEEAELARGEVVEIDDGLKPYYFYYLSWGRLVPLSHFDRDRTDKRVVSHV